MKDHGISLGIGEAPPGWLEERFFMQHAANMGYVLLKTQFEVEDTDAFLATASADFTIVDSSDRDNTRILTHDRVMLSLSHGKLLSVFKDQDAITWFLQNYSDHVKKYSKNSVSVFYYYLSQGDSTSRWIELNLDEMPKTYPELYPDIDVEVLTEDFAEADESVLLLYGKPGVGKTTFLKYMLGTGKYRNVAYIKDMEIMKKSDFWSTIAASNYDLLIFDDLDFAVGPRAEGDEGFVTNLLSYSDGIFNDRSKIVITTNQSIDRIDEALIRPGRCFDFLVLKSLSYDEALNIWSNVLEREPTAFMEIFKKNEDVTQAALMAAYRKELAAHRDRSYMKKGSSGIMANLAEAGVSVRDKAGFR